MEKHMEQSSMIPHQPNARAWLQHPLLILLLPYSVRTVPIALDAAALHMVFDANREPWRQIAVQGLWVTVQRRYHVVSSAEQLQIHGPYGNKAWTMTTLVRTVRDEHGMRLTLRTFPHRRIVLGLLAQLVFISVCAMIVGMPAAPWFPLIFFGPFLYLATVIATRVEAARLESLVREVLEQAATEEKV
jgi:hypothetical protein